MLERPTGALASATAHETVPLQTESLQPQLSVCGRYRSWADVHWLRSRLGAAWQAGGSDDASSAAFESGYSPGLAALVSQARESLDLNSQPIRKQSMAEQVMSKMSEVVAMHSAPQLLAAWQWLRIHESCSNLEPRPGTGQAKNGPRACICALHRPPQLPVASSLHGEALTWLAARMWLSFARQVVNSGVLQVVDPSGGAFLRSSAI